MRLINVSIVIVLCSTITSLAQRPTRKLELPDLHKIKTAVLSPSYSCRPVEDSGQGYQNTALFLSPYSKERNSPDLLFNGACRLEDYFEASTAGDDMSLIADLGAGLSLEEISASRAFNLKRVHSFAAYSRFVRTTKIELNHTYAVLLNAMDKRGLLVFTVVDHVPNVKVELRYVVKSYQVMPTGQIVAAGFDWERTNN